MSVHVTLRDQTSTGHETGSFELTAAPASITLRDLIRTRVRDEVARYHASPDRAVFHGLVMPEGASDSPDGFRMLPSRRIDWEQQADAAIEAFRRNGFFILVDGRQVAELDEQLALTDRSDVRFVRLVPLVGG